MNYYDVEINFFPVGQGLFSAGFIQRREKVFSWIYDCGTASSQKFLNGGMNQINTKTSIINLLILSHFHPDHISGIKKILKKFKVKILLLPFIPLYHRLLIAFNQKVSLKSKLMQFFLNPVKYISSIPGISIEKIVFVPPSSGTIEVSNMDQIIAFDDFSDDVDWTNAINFEEQNINDEERIDLQIVGDMNIPILFMKIGSSIIVNKLFEFIPYNDQIAHKFSTNFFKSVNALQDKIYNGSPKEKTKSFDLLKMVYIKEFGKNKQNDISLFIYAGPITDSTSQSSMILIQSPDGHSIASLFDVNYTLYTGDGYLNNTLKINALINYLNASKIKQLGFMQIMHHGSKYNWCSGLAANFKPKISIFSSDPSHKSYRHPHSEVLHDFSPYLPILVNQKNSLQIKYAF